MISSGLLCFIACWVAHCKLDFELRPSIVNPELESLCPNTIAAFIVQALCHQTCQVKFVMEYDERKAFARESNLNHDLTWVDPQG